MSKQSKVFFSHENPSDSAVDCASTDKMANSNSVTNRHYDVLDKMLADYMRGPGIFHASKHWERLNQLNVGWLKEDGIENFKRSVNNNYFNWMLSAKSPFFLNTLRAFVRRNLFHPVNLLSALFVRLDSNEMGYRTSVSDFRYPGLSKRKQYALYLRLLHDFVLKMDTLDLFRNLEEPAAGNPICIKHKGRRISQDICNSYLEYLYINTILGEKFSDLKCICEIGSGYGRLIYLFKKLAAKKTTKYILVDIPPALFIAQWYLRKSLPDAQFFEYRDFVDFADIKSDFEKASICFLLPHQLEMLPDKYIDLIINISSFHEMLPAQIKKYYDIINKKTSYFYTKQWLFWENPDDKIAVPAVIYPTNPEWQLVAARLNPVHTTFFEAMFKIS